jgi:hypothetical protein
LGYSCRGAAEQERGDVENDTETTYEKPLVTDFGSISDHTFTTPSGKKKGCKTGCHIDMFGEMSAGTV